MWPGSMNDPTRRLSGAQGGHDEAPDASENDAAGPSAAPLGKEFVGDAMRSLLSSADVSIARGDATRVIGRSQPPLPAAPPSTRPPAPVSSTPPGPRVDYTLWMVLAVGLFAIAGYMLSAAL